MKFIFIFLCIFSSVQANYPYFKFNEKKLKLNRDSFYRYIRPQLRNIRSEFFHITKKISPAHNEIIKLRSLALSLKVIYLEKFNECEVQKRDQLYCDIDISPIQKEVNKLDVQLTKLRFYILEGKHISSKKIDNYLLLTKHIDEIEELSSKIQHFLELRSIAKDTLYSTYTRSFSDLTNTINRIFTLANFVYIDFLPKDVQPAFERLLFHFIGPIEIKMIDNFEAKWFKSHLGKLNLDWNTFHMEVEKGNTSFPRNLVKIVKIMHNRWNSILKMMF